MLAAVSPLMRFSIPRASAPLRAAGAHANAFDCILGDSETVRDAKSLARRVAASPLTTVLLAGETGTGKELFARGIHSEGDAAREPFVAVNCAAIPDSLLESELFGYEPGAFTDAKTEKRGLFECAEAGSIFLDEISEMPRALQPKLLRVLEERRFRRLGGTVEHHVNCRVIAGTNRALEAAVEAGEFRSDLFYRLNVFRIDLPALRDRGADVIMIAEYVLSQIAERRGVEPLVLDPETKLLLQRHRWPGNIRELRNVIERATILASGGIIRPHDLRISRRESVPVTAESVSAVASISIPPEGKSMEQVERELIRLTMMITAGNATAAAQILGISRPTLLRKMKLSGITRRSLLASS
jgi:transcriptional regulator with PAS, ATPase and Fis domain